jgi:hypothetical protein
VEEEAVINQSETVGLTACRLEDHWVLGVQFAVFDG